MMKHLFFSILCFCIVFSCQPRKGKDIKETVNVDKIEFPFIERLDPALNQIISEEAKVEILAEGFDWTEGPLWIKDFGLLFSDIPPNKIFKWTRSSGVELYLTPSGYTGEISRGGEMGSNALLLDLDGNLVLCQHGDRRVAQLGVDIENPSPEYITIVDNYQGKKLNSPNDACYDKNGNLFFTDPPYGLEYMMEDPLKELDFQGVYRYLKDGQLQLLTDQLSRPNGIALSPDEQTLYVANSDPEKAIWMAYEIDERGNIINEKVFHDATQLVEEEPGLPDGLKVDHQGNIFASGPGGIWIFNSQGKILGKIKTGQATSNCAIGNEGKMLYITADMYLMSVPLIN